MPPSARLLAPLEAAASHATNSLYVCSTCRRQFLPHYLRLANQPFRRYKSSDNLPFTEKIRRKIWGTDNPPGLKDPYGGEGFFEQMLRERREARGEVTESRESNAAEEQGEVQEQQEGREAAEEYVPASTWDGLPRIGHLGEWYEEPPTEEDVFTP